MTDGRADELRALTGARGIAAWLVVGYHLRGSMAGLPGWLSAVFAKGYLAVDFFFLLSGFVMWLTWSARLRGAGRAGATRFWLKRVARIAPLHLVIMVGAILMAGALTAAGHPDRAAFPWATLPANLLLVQEWGTTDRLTWNDPAWSISAEMMAYLLFPLLVGFADWRRLPSAALVGLAAAAFALLAWIMRGASGLGDAIPTFGVVRCVLEFTGGTLMCALWLRWRAWRYATSLAGAALIIGVVCRCAGAPEVATLPATLAAMVLLLALTPGRRRNPLETPLVHHLGVISYATYLAHFLLWKAFKLAFVTAGHPASPAILTAYGATLLMASMLLYRTVERPALRWLTTPRPRKSIHAVPANVEALHPAAR